MRFPVAAILFLIGSFIFFVIYATCSLILNETAGALLATANANATATINMIQTGFGVIAAVFFFVGLLLIFILDSTADEPEEYWRGY